MTNMSFRVYCIAVHSVGQMRKLKKQWHIISNTNMILKEIKRDNEGVAQLAVA